MTVCPECLHEWSVFACEKCGARWERKEAVPTGRCETVDWDGLMARVKPMLPQGAVVLSAAQLEVVRELRRQVEQLYALGPMQGGPSYATSGMCRAIASVHAMLAAKDGAA